MAETKTEERVNIAPKATGEEDWSFGTAFLRLPLEELIRTQETDIEIATTQRSCRAGNASHTATGPGESMR